jgi:uncharacterized protein YjdB
MSFLCYNILRKLLGFVYYKSGAHMKITVGKACFFSAFLIVFVLFLYPSGAAVAESFSIAESNAFSSFESLDSPKSIFSYPVPNGNVPDVSMRPLAVYSVRTQSSEAFLTAVDGENAGDPTDNGFIELFHIDRPEILLTGDVSYVSCVADFGWQTESRNGRDTGISGSKLQALRINLSGELGEKYDIYYRLFIENFGWMNWSRNGAPAGVSEMPYAALSVQVIMLPKGSTPPAGTGQSYIYGVTMDDFIVETDSETSKGPREESYAGEITVGSQEAGESPIKGLTLQYSPTDSKYKPQGELIYQIYTENKEWINYDESIIAEGGKAKEAVDAVRIWLAGDLSRYYDIYYQSYCENIGWLGWAKNGQVSGTTGMSSSILSLRIRFVNKNEEGPISDVGSSITNYPLPTQDGFELSTFGTSAELPEEIIAEIKSGIESFRSRGHKLAFVVMDLSSGAGFYYNSNEVFYAASSIKGPYVVSLVEGNPQSASRFRSVMTSTIKVSDNNCYSALRRAYGRSLFEGWLADAGVTDVNPSLNYPGITANALAKMWLKNRLFFESRKPESEWCASLFTHTLNSCIDKALGDKYTVYSKAGWIGNGGYVNVQNDGGLVMANENPYVLVILSSAYSRMDLLKPMVEILDRAHEAMVTK